MVEYVELDTLFTEANLLVIHIPLWSFNAGLINNSHRQMVVEQGLADTPNCDKIAAGGLDVVSAKPVGGGTPYLNSKTVLSPHICPGVPRRDVSISWTALWKTRSPIRRASPTT